MSIINNEINKKNENYFIEINTKSNFELNLRNDYTYLDKLFTKEGLEKEIEFSLDFNLINEYLNSLFIDCNFDPFLTSLCISKNIISNQSKKSRNEIYLELDYFFQNSKQIIPNFTAFITKHFRLIGFTFCYIYEQLKKFNIDNMEKLSNEINEAIENKINIYDEYIKFVGTKNNWKNNSSLKSFVNKYKNKYKLPCELLLLINYFKNIYTLEIDYENLILNDDDFLLLTITLINIDLIYKKVNYIKLKLINSSFQNDIYSRYFRLEKDALNYTNRYIKYSNIINEKNFFSKEKHFNRDFHYQQKNINLEKEDELDNSKTENDFIPDLMNEKININDIIVKYKNFLSVILITFHCLQKFINMTKFDLIINENYSYEFKFLFRKYCFLNQSNSFSIINFLQMKDNIKSLNLELNFIDSITTYKVLEFIYKNKLITELQISFFSSEVSYIHQAIYKLYYEQKDIKKENKLNYIAEPELYYLNKIIKNFEENLNLLFDIIVSKNNLSKLILYFDIPPILINNQLYMILILKFILNILFLIDDNNYSINIFTIFSPDITLDKDICPFIEDYLEEFDTYKNNETLIELNLKFKINKIVNINKLVSAKLIILNIGDFDLISFEIFVKYLISYKFSSISNLKKLSIGLLKSIINFSPKITSIISNLYSIPISSLLELNLITNLIIDNKENYFKLLSNLKYHWISSSNIILNDESKYIIEENKEFRNRIKYLELNFEEEMIINNRKTNKAIECYWILKYFFIKKFNIINDIDKITFGIFRYLNYVGKMTITHN